ncbi:MAG: hypothetical protein ACMXYF_02095 [Candidatus Woesearchaeota archaeon]
MNKIIKLILYFLVLPLVIFNTINFIQTDLGIGGFTDGGVSGIGFPFEYHIKWNAFPNTCIDNEGGETNLCETFKPLNLVANFTIYLLFSLLFFYFFEIRRKIT